jgi:hypothetical protein
MHRATLLTLQVCAEHSFLGIPFPDHITCQSLGCLHHLYLHVIIMLCPVLILTTQPWGYFFFCVCVYLLLNSAANTLRPGSRTYS